MHLLIRSAMISTGLWAFLQPASAFVGTGVSPIAPQSVGGVQQLRIYEIPPQNEQHFHSRFRDHTLRIMTKYGFRIWSTWRSVDQHGTVRFIYLLDWQDRRQAQSAWAAFLADSEWQRIKAETGARHGRFVNAIADHLLEPLKP